MATQRYVSTSFWNDPWVLDELSSDERYTYLYLLTAPGSNIAGVFELSMKTAEMHTGYDRDQLMRIFKRFEAAGKAYYHERYVIIPTWPKHQRYQERKPIREGIVNVLKSLPETVWRKVCSVDYQFPLTQVDRKFMELNTPSTPQEGEESPRSTPEELRYSESETETDMDTESEKEAAAPDARASTGEESLPAVVEHESEELEVSPDAELYDWIKNRFEAEQPHHRFTNYGKEGKAIKGIIAKSRDRDPTNVFRFAEGMVETFAELRRRDRKFFGGQPFLPSSLNATGIWDRVLSQAYERWQQAERIRAGSFEDVPW